MSRSMMRLSAMANPRAPTAANRIQRGPFRLGVELAKSDHVAHQNEREGEQRVFNFDEGQDLLDIHHSGPPKERWGGHSYFLSSGWAATFASVSSSWRVTAGQRRHRALRRGMGVVASQQRRFIIVKGEPPHIKASRQLPKQAASGFRVGHVQVVIGDEQPAKVLFIIQLPN